MSKKQGKNIVINHKPPALTAPPVVLRPLVTIPLVMSATPMNVYVNPSSKFNVEIILHAEALRKLALAGDGFSGDKSGVFGQLISQLIMDHLEVPNE